MTIRHTDLELAELKRMLVAMGDLVQQSVDNAGQAILRPEADARERARALEDQLDTMETDIEDRCISILTLLSPVASDMRFVVSAMRVVVDLERIGDLAESVCKRARYIARHQAVRNPPQLLALVDLDKRMIRETLEALTSHDLALPRALLDEEKRTDALTKESYRAIQAAMAESPELIVEFTHLMRAIGNLEDIADLCVSIAEEVVFMVEARLVRHQHGELREG